MTFAVFYHVAVKQMIASGNRLLVIGLDAATFDLILPWAAEGRLPHLAGLLARGAYGPLRSVANLNSLAAWTTFMTGKNPGRHGIYWFYEHEPGSYNLRFLNGADVAEPRFWEILSAAGKRVGVINVPMTYPARPVNGFLIAGLDAPGESSPGFTYPPGLYDELRRETEGYLIDTNILGYARSGRWDRAIAATQQVIDQRARAAEYLMTRYPWDLSVVVFTALDRVQHTFWWEPGAAQVARDIGRIPPASDVVRAFYQRLDDVADRLVALAGEEATVVVMSDHGAGFNPGSNMYLTPWLESLGLFRRASATRSGKAKAALRFLVRRASALADGLLSQQARRWVLRHLPGGRAGLVGRLHRVPCDWARTKAYADYIQPAIWVNLRGREPQGIVEPGAEYEALRTMLINQLARCRDPKTGMPIAKGVYRREEVYHGQYLDKAPDLHIDWNYEAVVCGYRYEDESGRTVTVDTPADMVERRNVSGDHRPQGILIIAGPHVHPGQKLSGAGIADIAPTLLYLMEQPVPEDRDGRVLLEALREQYVTAHPVAYCPAGVSEGQERRDLSAQEAEQVEKRLRGLGYLG